MTKKKDTVKVKDKKIRNVETPIGIIKLEVFEGSDKNIPFIAINFLRVVRRHDNIIVEIELGGFLVRYQDDGIFYSLRSYPNEEEHNFEKVMDYNLFGDDVKIPKELKNEIKTISNEVDEYFDDFMIALLELYNARPIG